MRFVHVKYPPENLSKIRDVYENKIIPGLKDVEGCLFASLVISESHPDEGISFTLWDSKEHVEEYEKVGLYYELLGKVLPLLSESSVWKVQLSKDMKLEYAPVPEEPVVKSFATVVQSDPELPADQNKTIMYLRVVSLKIKPEKMEDFRKQYSSETIPALKKVKGCRFAYLTKSAEEKNEVVSVTLWDSREDAENYEKSGLFEELIEKHKDTFAHLFQWKMALEKEEHHKAVTSEDITIMGYNILTGKSLK
ncbi:antibiotic biosynthesis monooxygenase [candidate division KSB1 bacterium]